MGLPWWDWRLSNQIRCWDYGFWYVALPLRHEGMTEMAVKDKEVKGEARNGSSSGRY